MRPSLPFSLLPFICLISVAPISSSFSDCKRFKSCGNNLTNILNSRSSSSDQSLPPLNSLPQFVKPIPKVKITVEEPVSTEDTDTPSKVISSSESTYIQSVVYGTAQYPGWNRNNSSQRDYRLNDGGKDSEPLVIGIVAFFILALIVLEIVNEWHFIAFDDHADSPIPRMMKSGLLPSVKPPRDERCPKRRKLPEKSLKCWLENHPSAAITGPRLACAASATSRQYQL